MAATKQITGQKLHAILREAGFHTSKTETTSVRGWHRYTQGYTVKTGHECFTVDYRNDSQGYGAEKNIDDMRSVILSALTDAGLDASIDPAGHGVYVANSA